MNLDGYTLAASGSYFFQQAGLDPANSFTLTLVSYAVQICACLVTWFIMKRFGRRPVYILGLGITVLIQLAIGGLGIPAPAPRYAWVTGGVCWFFNIVFNLTRGPLTYTIITDAPSTRLRSKTVVFARAVFLLTAVFMVVLTNYQINAANWNCKYSLFSIDFNADIDQGEEKRVSSGRYLQPS
jgi:SP family general alpha glucoside:H+ symporter-like MFS transporter